MNPNSRQSYSYTFSVPNVQANSFVFQWNQIQDELIEQAVALQEAKGFPQVQAIINQIKG